MPYSSALWMAASLQWILDAANNITLEPYRAYVGDRLDQNQYCLGYLCQAAFTGLTQTLSYLAPSILVYGFGVNKEPGGREPHSLHHQDRLHGGRGPGLGQSDGQPLCHLGQHGATRAHRCLHGYL